MNFDQLHIKLKDNSLFKNKNNQCYRYCINDNWSFVIMEKDRHLYWNQFSAIENYKDEIEDDYENEDENYDDENEDEPQYFYNSNDDYDDQHIEAELYENGYNEND